MKEGVYSDIKKEYDDFYKSLLKEGKLPMFSTKKGFWSASISDEIFNAFKQINLKKSKNFLDIGSGDGKVTLIAALFCKNSEGVEIDDFLHKMANLIKLRFGITNATFHNRDFMDHDFSKYDFMFISPDAPMERGIEKKLSREMDGNLLHQGFHFHPKILKRKKSFMVNGNMFSVYSR